MMTSYSDLPPEIVFNIITRLPTKSVGLWRCVSKSWLAMLSEPNFIKTHLQITKVNSLESLAVIGIDRYESDLFFVRLNNAGIDRYGSDFYFVRLNNAHHMFDEMTLSLTRVNFNCYKHPSLRHVYGSCDGLLMAENYQGQIVVMNPITREIRQVPPSPVALNFRQAFFMYGFGYDSVNDDYKIVIISVWHSLENSRYPLFDIYSLKTSSWKRLENSLYNYVGSRLTPGVFVGGRLHWLDNRTTDNKPAIVAFDFADEKFREVPHPSLIFNLEGDYKKREYKIGVTGGCLCMCYANLHCEIWVMKEYGVPESWTKFAVNKPHGWFECFLSGQEQVVLMFPDNNRVMWSLKQGTLKDISFNGFNCRQNQLRVKASFIESLVSPHGRVWNFSTNQETM